MDEPYQLQLFDYSTLTHTKKIEFQVISKRRGCFTDNMNLPIHRWFRYSAGFSSAWVEEVIRELQPKTILDPFVGSGTVCIVADQLGVNSYGVEAHPFVYRLAKGKLAWRINVDEFQQISEDIINFAAKIKPQITGEISSLLSKCYTNEVLIKLLQIRESYLQVSSSLSAELQSLIFLAISAILRPSSFVGTAQWQYILPNHRKAKVREPLDAFRHQINIMSQDIYYMQSIAKYNRANLILGDARNLANIADQSIDLVITSPPYANNYDYADATRLEMTFWGEVNAWKDLHHLVRKYLIRSNSQHVSKEKLRLEQLLSEAILEPIQDELIPICQHLAMIRGHRGGNKAYHTMIAAYFIDMALVFRTLRRVMNTGGKMCFIVGDSAPYGVHVPVEKWLGKLAIASGFNSWYFEQIRQRNIKWKNRKHNVLLQEGFLWIVG